MNDKGFKFQYNSRGTGKSPVKLYKCILHAECLCIARCKLVGNTYSIKFENEHSNTAATTYNKDAIAPLLFSEVSQRIYWNVMLIPSIINC